ncbi:MAG: hypothetical protein HYX78_07690 [Armatimonadetes bacterium]|nr:hypothetical protein [Armatimonadota bacterium]
MNAGLGFVLALAAGLMLGTYGLPLKWTGKWAWENTWLVFATVGMIIIPWGVALITTPGLLAVYASTNAVPLAMTFIFGAAWGVGNVLFGLSLAVIGMSLTYAIALGLTTAVGSLVPMAASPQVFATPGGMLITLGVVFLVVGVAISAVAGNRRDAQKDPGSGEKQAASSSVSKKKFVIGLIMAVFAGLFSAMLNFAFTFGGGIREAALAAGASAGGASDAIWAFTLLGGYAVNLVFCATLLTKNRTWSTYAKPRAGSHWIFAALMAVLWMFSVTIYGRAADMMGTLGGSAGWAIYIGLCIAASNIWGVLTGEWRNAEGGPLRTMYAGMAVIVAATAIVGYGNALVK